MEPLSDIHLLSLAVNIPGPAAVARLRQLGATVVKVEPPTGDLLAQAAPDWFAELHKGVEIKKLDLKSTAGQAQLGDLLGQSDLLLTSLRPAALDRLGLAWPILSKQYPRLCQVAIIGYPSPDENKPGHDLTYQAALGLLDPPRLPRTVMADLAGAEWAVSAALALLLARERAAANGRQMAAEDRYKAVPLADAIAAFAKPLKAGLTAPNGLLGGLLPGYNLYPAQEGWVAVAALEPHFLMRLGQELGLADLRYDSLAEIFQSRPAEAWESWAAGCDLPIAAVRQ
jgi:alpha-methylacyl-CoA racemase